MRKLDTDQDDHAANILWWANVCLAGAVLGISVLEIALFSFSFSKLIVLTVSIFAATLVCKYKFDLPYTSASFLPKTLFAFWGVIWIGISGGVVLGAAAAIATRSRSDDRRKSLATISTDTVSTFVAAVTFYLVMSYLASPETLAVTGKLFVPMNIIYASVAMAAAHFGSSSLIEYLFAGTEFIRKAAPETDNKFPAQLFATVVTLAATIAFFLVFNHFGIEFGLVMVPIAIFGNIAYEIHIRRLEQKTKEIREASRLHLATVEALATAIDARDQVGIGHVRRTQIYAVGIGDLLGLSAGDIDALRTGALLHDIGKLAVPDHILNKPGKLTPGEMEKAKIHSTVGAAILENIGFPNPVVPTVKYHHEFWDGSGYPEKLAGADIPLTARILTVADAFDTLRGARPYRPAVPRDEACSFLRARAGSQFDPQIVDLFIRNLKRFEDEIVGNGLSYEHETDQLNRANAGREDHASMTYVEQIQSANREVFTLYSLAKDFSSALDLEETLSLFTRKIEDFVPFDTCLVYLMEPGEEYATAVHAVGRHGDVLKGKRVELGEGATGYALKQRKAVNNVDPALDFTLTNTEIGHEYVAMASLPLMAEERLVGAISLYSNSMPNYEDEHMRLIETVSRIAADAVARSLQHAQAETYASTDPMTGLPNARSLQIHFDKESKRANRAGANFQVLMLDLDGFKAVNDTHGHKAGDRMLKELAGIIRAELRDYDFLARYAGDEFVAMVPDTDSHGVLELCRRIEASVNAFALPVGEGFTKVGVSVGSACYPNHGETFDQLLIAADKAMYMTKAVHKQRFDTAKPVEKPVVHQTEEHQPTSYFEVSGVSQLAEAHVEILGPDDQLIVELDESHIISLSAVN